VNPPAISRESDVSNFLIDAACEIDRICTVTRPRRGSLGVPPRWRNTSQRNRRNWNGRASVQPGGPVCLLPTPHRRPPPPTPLRGRGEKSPGLIYVKACGAAITAALPHLIVLRLIIPRSRAASRGELSLTRLARLRALSALTGEETNLSRLACARVRKSTQRANLWNPREATLVDVIFFRAIRVSVARPLSTDASPLSRQERSIIAT
jgi:hypothetical protein